MRFVPNSVKSQTPAAQNKSDSTNLDQAGEVFQHSCHRKLQEVVVPQVEPGQVEPGEHAQGEAPQQVGVQEQQLEGRHGVKGAGIHLPDLVVLEVQVPTESSKNGDAVFCSETEGTKLNSLQSFPSIQVTQYTSTVT